MSQFVPGQRWVVDSEPELGLGVVLSIEGRSVTLAFPLAECQRMYAIDKAPLTRIIFEPNDKIEILDVGEVVVKSVSDVDGVCIYTLENGDTVTEVQLAHTVKMNQPFLRLLTGQLDKSRWFAFRRQLDQGMARTWQSQLAGFFGARTSLIPHQLYVARSACERDKVRVLLADEVGLGKTIEAGLILSRLMRYQRVSRVLVCVPEALQVQWLVELKRRFSIAAELYVSPEHEFDMGQVHVISHQVLHSLSDEQRTQLEFDLIIVDEAHHILPESPEFQILEELAASVPHLVLLSATPEQLGVESHFARLRLLDPLCYTDFASFADKESHYAELNQAIQALPDSKTALAKQYGLPADIEQEALVDRLLDCHGTGRVMFRNTRASISGFPTRRLYKHLLHESTDEFSKFDWLLEFSRANRQEKILVICHAFETVKACEEYLWRKHGLDTAVFHENMTLLERDRAAAYFAETDSACQILLCSEIGSEGRNFQFCHHLVCMDLPEHPDLLEQRIGRLDRIGQTQDVNVHVLVGDPDEQKKLDWYHEVLQCIERQSPAAGVVHDAFWRDVAPLDPSNPDLAHLCEQAAEKLTELEAQIAAGRDALLELNSCRQPTADTLVAGIAQREQETPKSLVESASDLLNFHFEELGEGVYSLIPADNMLIPSLPGIPLEGTEVAFDRQTANIREDTLFLSWDAPFIVGLWEVLNQSDLGAASVALWPNKKMPAGRCLIEGCFELLVQSQARAECLPYFDCLSIRSVTLDIGDRDISAILPEETVEASLQKVDKKLARQIIQSQKSELSGWYEKLERFAQEKLKTVVDASLAKVEQHFAEEKARIDVLAQYNPNVSDAEIEQCESKWQRVTDAISHRTSLRLSAIRLIVITEPQHV